MPGSLLACVLVNPLWPQQQVFCQVLVTSMATAVTMVSAVLPQHHQSAWDHSDLGFYWTQDKCLHVVHHLGQERVPCQDVHIKRNVWERVSGFQTLLGAQQSLHTAKPRRSYLACAAAWRALWGLVGSSGSPSGSWTQLQVPSKPKMRTSVEVWALHQPHPKASHAPRSLCRSCAWIASRSRSDTRAVSWATCGSRESERALFTSGELSSLADALQAALLCLSSSEDFRTGWGGTQTDLLELCSIQKELKDWELPEVRQRFAPLLHTALCFPCTVVWKL